jgi:hypothetical protein
MDPLDTRAAGGKLRDSDAPVAAWQEAQVRAFEQAARGRERVSIKEFLDALPDTISLQAKWELILELIAVDLELRWQGSAGGEGRGPRLELYCKQFPQLGSLDNLPLWLVAEEYRVRRRWGDAPEHAEYLARFPRQGLALSSALADVDGDLRAEGSPIAASPPRPIAGFPAEPIDPAAPLFHGDYFLRRLIGMGGMCKVYTAVQRSLARPVAVKVLKKSSLVDARCVARFLREAHIAARLRHPAVVPVHGLGRLPDGGYFMVMDLIEGEDLARKSAPHGVRPEEAASLTAQAAEAVAYCHAAGVVHGDLKPSNLLADSRGAIHLTDFGLAWEIGLETALFNDARYIAGTAAYMAPEQVDRRWGEVSAAADIYSLGGVLYTLLSGRPPWGAAGWEATLARVAAPDAMPEPLERGSELRNRLNEICGRCLSKDQSQRYAGANELAVALRTAAES